MNNFSLIQWNNNINEAPLDDLLVYVKDTSGDYEHKYVTYAYHIARDLWIKDNDFLYGEILLWAKMPEIIIPM